jgi:hypothetical protein
MSGRFTTTYPFPIPPPKETDWLAQPFLPRDLKNNGAPDQHAKEESSNDLYHNSPTIGMFPKSGK